MNPLSIANEELLLFLERHPSGDSLLTEIDLSRFFREILKRANDFVPSEAGSIYLAERNVDRSQSAPRHLVLVASYGAKSHQLLGAYLGIEQGIAGFVFQEGQAFVSATPSSDLLRDDWLAGEHRARAGSVVAVPLEVGGQVVGVLELLKQRDGEAFDERELELLELFAGTISAAIANAVEAQRSRDMARRDDLTRLFNDRYLHHVLTDVLRDAMVSREECALLFLDLDRFKQVNDRYGHLVGSRVLRETGDLLRQVLPGGSVPARYGGDEFVVILPGHGAQEARWVAESIRQTVEGHRYLEQADPGDPEIYPALALRGMTFSIGVATLGELLAELPRDPEVLAVKNELLRRADERMYEAKESGRNRTVVAKRGNLATRTS